MPPKPHIEQEIKLTAPDESTLQALLGGHLLQSYLPSKPSAMQTQQLRAFYYDTADWRLRDMRWSLRTRKEDSVLVAALKRNSKLLDGLSTCEEMEQTISHRFERVGDIPNGLILAAMREHFSPQVVLVPRVEVIILRQKAQLLVGDALIEFAVDAGSIKANSKQQALFEIELELLSGSLQDDELIHFVESLSAEYALRPSIESKHQIGLSLYKPHKRGA